MTPRALTAGQIDLLRRRVCSCHRLSSCINHLTGQIHGPVFRRIRNNPAAVQDRYYRSRQPAIELSQSPSAAEGVRVCWIVTLSVLNMNRAIIVPVFDQTLVSPYRSI